MLPKTYSNLQLINQIPEYPGVAFIYSFISVCSSSSSMDAYPALERSGFSMPSARTPTPLLSYNHPMQALRDLNLRPPMGEVNLCFSFTSPGVTKVTKPHVSTKVTGGNEIDSQALDYSRCLRIWPY